MENRIIVAGFGGQGVLLIGQVLCHAGMESGMNVSWLPSYGPEMRGGTASCSVILAEGEIGSPMATQADACIVMNTPSFEKYQSFVRPGGQLLVNSSLIGKPKLRDDILGYFVPCNEVAAEAGNLRTANMAMLGAFNHITGYLSTEAIHEALAGIFGERRAHLLPVNYQAMELGAAAAEEAK